MIRVMLAAPRSGGGKTAVTCALLRALARRGLAPCAFKCGPDYLDPTFHRAAGVESRNLDLFLSDAPRLRDLYARACRGHGAAVAEGAMGYYDGVGGTGDRASAWHVADTLDIPVVLVVRARGASLTLAAEIAGLRSFRRESHIVGVILNECAPALRETLAPMLERETCWAVYRRWRRRGSTAGISGFARRRRSRISARVWTRWRTRWSAGLTGGASRRCVRGAPRRPATRKRRPVRRAHA